MPASVPLNNAVAQNTFDFNNQRATNASGLSRYKINEYNTSARILNNADLNAVCVFSGNTTLTLGNNFSPVPPVFSEIIFYSTNGYVRISSAVGTTVYSDTGLFIGKGKVGKLVYVTSNTWFFASVTSTVNSFNFTDCCSDIGDIYQIGQNPASLNTSAKAYTNASVNIPFNGSFQIGENIYSVANGDLSIIGGCPFNVYQTAYTFYTAGETGPDPVTLYSVSGLTPSNYSTLLGKRFATSGQGSEESPIYDCALNDIVSPSTQNSYYGSTAQYASNSSATFLDGYVINYNGIPI